MPQPQPQSLPRDVDNKSARPTRGTGMTPMAVHNRVWEVRELSHVPSSRRRLASVKSSPPARAFPCPRCWKY